MLDGRYALNATTPMGPQKGFINIKTEGNALTGTMEMLNGVFDIAAGTCDGDSCAFETTVKAFGMTFKFKCEATVDGDKIKLSMTNPMAKVSAEGERVE